MASTKTKMTVADVVGDAAWRYWKYPRNTAGWTTDPVDGDYLAFAYQTRGRVITEVQKHADAEAAKAASQALAEAAQEGAPERPKRRWAKNPAFGHPENWDGDLAVRRYTWNGETAGLVRTWYHGAHDDCPGFGQVWDYAVVGADERRLVDILAGGVDLPWNGELPTMRDAQIAAERVLSKRGRDAVSA